jgi:hypothetical protein
VGVLLRTAGVPTGDLATLAATRVEAGTVVVAATVVTDAVVTALTRWTRILATGTLVDRAVHFAAIGCCLRDLSAQERRGTNRETQLSGMRQHLTPGLSTCLQKPAIWRLPAERGMTHHRLLI